MEVNREQVAVVVSIGRATWEIENQQVNGHKNHGYELERNYGHGHKTLSLIFSLLNLLGFVAHAILRWGDRLSQRCPGAGVATGAVERAAHDPERDLGPELAAVGFKLSAGIAHVPKQATKDEHGFANGQKGLIRWNLSSVGR
ncbi:MAG TPA: hypothetical protein VNM72_06280 [Blastocatellia bacterium]|nr:hypothetical protein [Blastocatellia bacterium]